MMEIVTVSLLGSVLGVLSLGAIGALYAFRRMTRAALQTRAMIDALFVPQEGGASMVVTFCDAILDRSLKRMEMTIKGSRSGEVRLENKAMDEVIEAQVSGINPMLTAALNRFVPGWKKIARNNPQIVGQLGGMLNGKTEGATAGQAGPVAQSNFDI